MNEPPTAESEEGLPDRRGEFTTSLPWIARFLLSATLGAVVGLAASMVLPLRAGQATSLIMMFAGAIAATLLSIRKVHSWYLSTFAEGTVVGLAAPPIFVVLVFVRAAVQPHAHITFGALGEALLAALFSFIGMPITVPCGWLAGFGYHIALSAAERARRGEDDSS